MKEEGGDRLKTMGASKRKGEQGASDCDTSQTLPVCLYTRCTRHPRGGTHIRSPGSPRKGSPCFGHGCAQSLLAGCRLGLLAALLPASTRPWEGKEGIRYTQGGECEESRQQPRFENVTGEEIWGEGQLRERAKRSQEDVKGGRDQVFQGKDSHGCQWKLKPGRSGEGAKR